ncbi:hypothetical protein BJP36_21310 [Moorena producens JHB]|uniref:Uncharacterized protein n=1 Tax=Moorena producens (strain JHB) TaxID=1454205 RepID=A0A1D9G3D2_MOOP1|nr:hypothetical protein [Moorena producens]AOY82061.1 hypothetical protein BJP36_21310 [Moorena producens JHB]
MTYDPDGDLLITKMYFHELHEKVDKGEMTQEEADEAVKQKSEFEAKYYFGLIFGIIFKVPGFFITLPITGFKKLIKYYRNRQGKRHKT